MTTSFGGRHVKVNSSRTAVLGIETLILLVLRSIDTLTWPFGHVYLTCWERKMHPSVFADSRSLRSRIDIWGNIPGTPALLSLCDSRLRGILRIFEKEGGYDL